VIWELVSELERVLLVLREETRAWLELLVEMRLALSSPITVEARVVVVVFSSVVVVSSSLLFLAHEMMVRLKRNMERMISRFFTWVPFGSLGEPNIYHQSVWFTRMWGFYLEGAWLCEELSVGYLQGVMGVSLKFENYKF